MLVTQVAIGRFHHFHLARQMEKHQLLKAIYTGYPQFKLKDEAGIQKDKIKTFPWLQMPYMVRGRIGLDKFDWLNKEWAWCSQQALDKFVAARIKQPTTLIALSASGLHAGREALRRGGHYICDRGSSHIRFQDQILREEYSRWGLDFVGVDPRIIAKEEQEYSTADFITVPSEFVRQSFISMGVPEAKVVKVVYGARLDRFSKVADPQPDRFQILWVGGVSIRKGFMYLLEAFEKLRHPKKELLVVGQVSPEVQKLLEKRNIENVVFTGQIANTQLPYVYSAANVFVLPSLEEGLALVQGEALACGCPVIASTNTGSSDLFTDGEEGFIVPVRSSEAILEKLQILINSPHVRGEMSAKAIRKVKSIGGWDSYGESYVRFLKSQGYI